MQRADERPVHTSDNGLKAMKYINHVNRVNAQQVSGERLPERASYRKGHENIQLGKSQASQTPPENSNERKY